jgi:hypothetical protein
VKTKAKRRNESKARRNYETIDTFAAAHAVKNTELGISCSSNATRSIRPPFDLGRFDGFVSVESVLGRCESAEDDLTSSDEGDRADGGASAGCCSSSSGRRFEKRRWQNPA